MRARKEVEDTSQLSAASCSATTGVPPVAPAALAGPLRKAVARTRRWLLDHQHPDGYWVAELEGDSILESETILLWAFLGREHTDRARRAAQYLVEKQLPEGGWAMYPGGDVDPSASVKAYFALKLTGHDLNAEHMRRARRTILAHGGADAVNSYTRFFLALLGQIDYRHCPAVPPEVVLLPKWFPIHLYAVSAWSRTIIVPLAVLWACKPVRRIDPELGIGELFVADPEHWPRLRCKGLPGGLGPFSWDCFFRLADWCCKTCERFRFLPFRRRALAAAERWMLERFRMSDGLGAIYPPIVWSIIALHCLGYGDESPELRECHRQLEALILEDDRTGSIRLQPCKSPVWDTAITLRALASAGVSPDDPAATRAVRWLLDREVTHRGDWAETVAAEPGGWYFEFANEFYPDNDDTAMVLMALSEQFVVRSQPASIRSRRAPDAAEVPPDEADRLALIDRTTAAIARGEAWMLAMQNHDGGWGAFDRNNNRRFLNHVPFADHNAMIDPSTPDLAARVLEALAALGRRVGDPAVDRAVAYLRKTQEDDGSWFGRWGVNYIYGTWQTLAGLAAVGVPPDDAAVGAAAEWLLRHQQPRGGWGETATSYDDPSLRGQGPPTASQTAWAILGLLAAGPRYHEAVARGVRFLIETQRDDGTWDEPQFTGTGFPRVFYLRYHYYRIHFPLLALSRAAAALGQSVAGAPKWQP